MNSIGHTFRVTSFGESHGVCVGVVIDGCPPGLVIDTEELQKEMNKRKATSRIHTARRETDEVQILSGVFEGKTTGAPLLCMIKNHDIDSSDYICFKTTPRPSHADFTQYVKYHGFGDHRGGGRSSGRITAGYVAAGYFAKKILGNVKIHACIKEVGGIKKNPEYALKKLKGDSVGGIIKVCVNNLPVGLGEPAFDTVEGEIAKAVFSIPGAKGIEFGAGFDLAHMKGSQANDEFCIQNGIVKTKTNNSGGVLGGITNGMPLTFNVVIKPTPSISLPQDSVDLTKMEEKSITINGRHDPCIVFRAVPVVEAVTSMVLADLYLRFKRWVI